MPLILVAAASAGCRYLLSTNNGINHTNTNNDNHNDNHDDDDHDDENR